MYYVSAVHDEIKDGTFTRFGKISITDTSDNVTETYTNADLVRLIYRQKQQFDGKLHVYGMYFYGRDAHNMYAFATPLTLGQPISSEQFMGILNKIRKLRNPWTMAKLEDYLAELKIGTSISARYYDYADKLVSLYAERVDVDTWRIDTNSNFPEESKINSKYLALHLDTLPNSSKFSFNYR